MRTTNTKRGESNIKDRIGWRRGKLVIVECVEQPRGTPYGGTWKAQCDCGNTKLVKGYSFTRHGWSGTSCGCATGAAIAQGALKRRNPRKTMLNSGHRHHLAACRQHGGTPLPIDKWETLVSQPCHYCGHTDIRKNDHITKAKHLTPTQAEIDAYDLRINGIDRVDARLGYEPGNMVPCCSMCNVMKNGYLVDDYLDKVKEVYEKHRLELKPLRATPYPAGGLNKHRRR